MSLIPSDALAIGVGAVFGALSRYQAGRVAAEYIAHDSKLQGWHTAGINVAGSFLLGGIAGTPSPKLQQPKLSQTKQQQQQLFRGMSPRTKLMLGVGFCGSFTTFSTYSVDVVSWINQGQTSKALSYVMANNAGGIVAAAAGLMVVKKFFP